MHIHTYFTWKYITDFHDTTVIKPELLIFILIPLRFAYLESHVLVAFNWLTIMNFFVHSSLLLLKAFGSHVRDTINVKKKKIKNQQMKKKRGEREKTKESEKQMVMGTGSRKFISFSWKVCVFSGRQQSGQHRNIPDLPHGLLLPVTSTFLLICYVGLQCL